jgi:kynurenine formamidase
MVLEESLVWPLKTYNSYVDHTIYQVVQMKTHVKTHIESPYHLDGKGKSLDVFPPETFFGRMVFFNFDVQGDLVITREMIRKADDGRLKGADIVVLHTSWTKESGTKMPQIASEGAAYFISKGIKVFGVDESIGQSQTHDTLLRNGIPLLEMLCNLDKLSQKVSFIIAIPGLMKIQGIDSSTVQAVVLEGMEVV